MNPRWNIKNRQDNVYPGAHTIQKNATFANTQGGGTDGYSNPGGTDEPAGIPDPPVALGVLSFTDDTITLFWDEPSDKGDDPASLRYPVEFKEDDGNFATGFSLFSEVTEPEATVDNLDPETNYVFRVASRTNIGQSEYTSVVTQQTLPSFPNVNQAVILDPFNDGAQVFNTYQSVITSDEDYLPATEDGDPVGVWNFNGGSISQADNSKRAILHTDVNNGSATFPIIEFQGGAKFDGQFIPPSDGTTGWEVIIVQRRFDPQPPTDRQTSGLWWITGESPTPPTTDSTDVHYPDDNGVIYERFGSDVRRSIFPIPIDLTQWHMYHIRAREGEYKVWLNNHLVINSTSNVLANAPVTPTQMLGISHWWPDGTSVYNGYFQMASAIFHVPDEGEDDTYREAVSQQLRDYYQARFDISNQAP